MCLLQDCPIYIKLHPLLESNTKGDRPILQVTTYRSLSRAMQSNDSDKFIFREKRRCFRGRAKIFLDHLDYHGISSRGKVDEKHVDQLINVFRSEGCMRLHDPEHYVPGLISSEELTRAVSYSKIRRLDLMQDGEPPILNLPDNLKIRVLHGEHRMRAAERFLEPREKWWVVTLYTPGKVISHKS